MAILLSSIHPFYVYSLSSSFLFALLYVYTVRKLTFRPPITTIVPYANSLNPDETPSNLASQPDPSCLTDTQTTFSQTLSHIEAL